MSINLNPLYHWSPARLRVSIAREGLKIMMPCRALQGDETSDVSFPWVCLGSTPSSAWGLILEPESEDPDHRKDGKGWDLWQVQVSENDRLEIRGDFSPWVREVRVLNSIPAERVWWVGSRLVFMHYGQIDECK